MAEQRRTWMRWMMLAREGQVLHKRQVGDDRYVLLLVVLHPECIVVLIDMEQVELATERDIKVAVPAPGGGPVIVHNVDILLPPQEVDVRGGISAVSPPERNEPFCHSYFPSITPLRDLAAVSS